MTIEEQERAANLTIRYSEGALSPEESVEYNALLRQSPEARRILVDFGLQTLALSDASRSPASGRLITSEIFWRRVRPALALAACLILFFGVFRAMNYNRGTDSIATIELLRGDLEIVDIDGQPMTSTVTAGRELRPGQTLATRYPDSSAILRFRDGTIVNLAGNTEIGMIGRQSKELFVDSGQLTADVAKQPSNAPMILRTNQAKMTVLGTTLALSVKPDTTRLEVISGEVDFTRLKDSHTVRVTEGNIAVADDSAPKESSPAPAQALPASTPPRLWSCGFENGELPAGWQAGELIALTDSKFNYGVRALPMHGKDGTTYAVITENAWTEHAAAHFEATERTNLLIRLKMDDPGWVGVVLGLRGNGGEGAAHTKFWSYSDPAWWEDMKPGEWKVIRLGLDAEPQKKFCPLPDPSPSIANHQVFSVAVKTASDRGLVVDGMTAVLRPKADEPPAR